MKRNPANTAAGPPENAKLRKLVGPAIASDRVMRILAAQFVSEFGQMLKRPRRQISRIAPSEGSTPKPWKIMTWFMRAFVRGLPHRIG